LGEGSGGVKATLTIKSTSEGMTTAEESPISPSVIAQVCQIPLKLPLIM